MQRLSALEQLRRRVFATMPPPPYFCILCGSTPMCVGAGAVDGIDMAYFLCEPCAQRDYMPAVIAKIRSWRLSRQHN